MVQLELVVIRCEDVDRSRHFYSALGLEFVANDTDGFEGRAGEVRLELCPSLGPQAPMRLGLRCAQISRVVDAMKAAGGSVVRTLGAPKLLYAVVKDPDGHTLELRSAD